MNLFAFALRNVGRNRRRTAITMAATAFAGFTMIGYSALMEGIVVEIQANALDLELGEIQLHPPGWREDPDLYKRIERADDLADALTGDGRAAAPRLYGFALAAADSTSAGVQLRGIDLDRERRVTRLHEHLKAGTWLQADDPGGAVVGRKLARSLGVGVGDEVVLLGQAADGSMANDVYRVRGILSAVGEPLDQSGFLMSVGAYRDLMQIPSGAHELVLSRPVDHRSEVHVDLLADDVRRVAAPFGELEVSTWRVLQPFVAQMTDMMGISLAIMMSILFIAIGLVLFNATLMSVSERIREFGILKAIGLSPGQVVALMLIEAAILALGAASIALAIGIPLAFWIERHGIDLSRFSADALDFAGVAMDPIWQGDATPRAIALPVAYLVGMVLLSALYPALKAGFLRPVDAIRHQ